MRSILTLDRFAVRPALPVRPLSLLDRFAAREGFARLGGLKVGGRF